MGSYLNSPDAAVLYAEVVNSPYFVDKSNLIAQILPRMDTTEKYLCVTRPRRFGKSVAANMIAAFLSKGQGASELFGGLKAAESGLYREHLNRHNVISISFNRIPRRCKSYEQYIERVEQKLITDLKEAYPGAKVKEEDALWDVLKDIYDSECREKFVFVLDEWDYIFHRDFVADADKADFIDFLSNLLKDQPYVELVYMTGILPIAKYSSGSELNMFLEYTMASEEMFGDSFGFTESEVDGLYQRYLRSQKMPRIARSELKLWYDGYHTLSGERVYNPRSVVAALTNNNLGNYWTSAGPYDEIFFYIGHNTDAVRDSLALMVSGIPVPAKAREYAATSANLTTRDEIFSAMVVYGFLSYENGFVSIPNKELMDKFGDMLQKEPSLGYVFSLAKESGRMLRATLTGDTDVMCEILSYTHNTEIPLLSYNREEDLTVVVMLAYLSARDRYDIRREEKAGVGYADFVFLPYDRREDCIIIELKVDAPPEDAIQQIKDRQYMNRFEGKLGEQAPYTGRILAVGIAYDRKEKKHRCKVEVCRERMI